MDIHIHHLILCKYIFHYNLQFYSFMIYDMLQFKIHQIYQNLNHS